MRVAVWVPGSHLGNWSWSEFTSGSLAVSGTDAARLRLLQLLGDTDGYSPIVLTGTDFPDCRGLEKSVCGDFVTAVEKAEDYDVGSLVFAGVEEVDYAHGIKEASRRGVPLIAWCHTHPSSWMLDLFAQEDCVRRLVCVSKAEADDLRHHPAFDKVEVVYNGIDPIPYLEAADRESRDRRQVCFLGALKRSKGFHHVARAWPRVREAIPDATLHVLGSAKLYDRRQRLGPLNVAEERYERKEIIPYLGASREEARALGVHFHGLVPPRDARQVIAESLIGIVNPIVTGSIETFCVSAVELQAGGAAVVGAHAGGLRETVHHGETGLLIRDEDRLGKAVVSLLREPEIALGMGKRGQKRVQAKFDLAAYRKRWTEVLTQIYNETPPSPPPLSWRRASAKVVCREAVRHARRIPGMEALIRLAIRDNGREKGAL